MKTPTPVYVKGVDCDDLRDVEDVAEAIEFSVVLTQAPSDTWWSEFEPAYASMPYSIKPQVRLDGNRIWVTYLPRYENEVQAYVEFITKVVERANEEETLTYEVHLKGHRSGPREQLRQSLKNVCVPSNHH